ncbi:general substrate transporter [Kockovaella imperatae]|uniref:General substrate transporter n=1 Tax=Kockovaella imperatae TaxID=4999 RepID=A0A1Y1UJL5_9TREE|nr:general substrate transporter [Kockovaella imperatae]ORX38169.1 general substrate transporter [Kockovaella imperatae]
MVGQLSPKLYTFLCAVFVASGAGLFGYDLGVIAYVLAAPDFVKTVDTTNANYIGFITSSLLLGAFVGTIPASYAADALSRRVALTIAGCIFIVGGVIQTSTQNKEQMMAGRFIAGLAIGQLGVLVPLYQSEIAHPSNRGQLTALFQLSLGIGAFVAGWIGYGCQQGAMGTQIQWRVPLAFQMLPAIPIVLCLFVLPESPRWLMIKGRPEEALASLARLHSRGNINDRLVQAEFATISAKLDEEQEMASRAWTVIFRDGANLRKVFYGVVLQFSVQMTGVSAIQYYANTVYSSVGFAKNALLINSLNNVNGLAAEALCVLFLDRVGRRPPLIYGNLAASVAFAVATAMAKQFATGGGTKGEGYAFVVMIFIYNFVFSFCIGPLSWVYPVEIMNTAVRAKATGITTSASWLANFMIGQVTPKAFDSIGWKYYLVFTICSMTNAIFFYLFFPETRGRTLEEMDELFRTMKLIVPLDKSAERVGKHSREEQLAIAGELKQEVEVQHEKL